MTREELKALGLTNEQVEKIVEDYKKLTNIYYKGEFY